MKNINNVLKSVFLAAVLIGCSTEDDLVEDWIDANTVEAVDPGTSGTIDVSNYVALGNSLTAGFADGALYTFAQQNSFPNLLAGQFALVDESVVFNQPDINSENGFNSTFSDVSNGVIAGRTVLDLSLQAPVPTSGELPALFAGDKAALNNFGVPGVVTAQLLTPATGGPDDPANPAYNGLYARFASNPGTSTILNDAVSTDPSFFSLWIGANDILAYAIGGGGPTARPITSNAEFNGQFQLVIDALKVDPGVVLTIPPVLLTPFFRAVTWDAIELDAATAETLNTSFAAVNGAIQGTSQVGFTGDVEERLVSYAEGNNPVLVHDEDLEDLAPYFDLLEGAMQITAEQRASLVPYEQSRPIRNDELVLLTAGAVLGTDAAGENTPIGVAIPLGFSFTEAADGDRFFLTVEEQNEINAAVVSLNTELGTIIATENAAGSDIAMIDVTPTFLDLFGVSDGELGIEIDGVTLSPDFAPNGVFSTDAIHPNSRGNAVVANLIITTINERWNASIPLINVLEKRGAIFQP